MSALEDALAQIVEHHDTGTAAEPAKGFLVELGPRLRTGTKDQQADRLAAVAQRHDEQPSAPVLAAFVVAHHGTGAVIDLGFFAGCGQNDANGLRGVSAAQFTHEAVDRLIAAAIAVLINQILPNGHGVTAAVKPQARWFLDTARRRWRWVRGWRASVADSLEFFLQSR